jgi:hypothetical protein
MKIIYIYKGDKNMVKMYNYCLREYINERLIFYRSRCIDIEGIYDQLKIDKIELKNGVHNLKQKSQN